VSPIDVFEDSFYENIYDEGESETTSNHHLLGYANGIQHNYHELNFIETVNHNIENISGSELNEALKWKLLFQCDSDDNLGISWGDWGRIYFFIHEDDLQKRNFENIKIAADCY